jgi:DNA-binding response OmpR family regulator
MAYPLCLIIEDDYDASNILMKLIERKGFEFEIISDGRSAIEQLSDKNPALILLDMHLPHVTGLQIFEFIRSQLHLAHTAVVVISADHNMTKTIEDAVDFVMLKPINIPQLSAIVDRIIYQRNLMSQ